MNNKYLSLIQNLVSNTKENKAMSGDELRARINNHTINLVDKIELNKNKKHIIDLIIDRIIISFRKLED